MTNSETKAKKFLSIAHPEGYIKKIPDFKQTKSKNGGNPDYLVIENGNHYWYEIKKLNNNQKSIGRYHFTESQLINFRKMIKAGAEITVLIVQGKEMYNLDFSILLEQNSVKLEDDKNGNA